MKFKPSPIGKLFLQSRKFIKIICGPVGGGKSTTALMAMWSMALQQDPHKTIRRSKFIILRNTMAQLKSTIKPLIDAWFVEMPEHALGEWRLSDNTFEIRIRLPDGTGVHTEFIMMAADTPEDVRRLLSVECTAAWVEEGREVDREVFSGLQGRVARFPSKNAGGVTYPCVIVSTNPPPIGTFWHELMTNPPDNVEVFMQPPALLEDGSINPQAENLENLHPDYYSNLISGKSDDWIGVYLKNKFGAGGFGQPIFRATFRKDFHITTDQLKPIPTASKKIIIGSDNGLQAAAVFGQENALGVINLIGEAFVEENDSMGYDRFLDLLVIPKLRDLKIPHRDVLFVVDPACFQRSQANEVTIAQEIRRRGFECIKTSTNLPERRISAVESLLMRQAGGGAMLRFGPDVPFLQMAMDWGYRNKKNTGGQTATQIDKNHFSHIAEALQYLALHFQPGGDAQYGVRVKEVVKRRFVYT